MLRFQFLSERCKDPGGEPFKRVGQIVEQVPPVSYLEGFGRAAPGSVGEDAITVAADDLGTWMFAEPLDDRISRGIFLQIDNAVRIRVHQNRAVAATAAKSKFVHPEYLYRLDWCLAECTHHAQ